MRRFAPARLRHTAGALLATPRTLVPQRRPRPDADGRTVCPGALGGVAYSPAAFSPGTAVGPTDQAVS